MTSTSVDVLNGARSSLAMKAPCAACTTANITLSGEQTVDGIALVTGNRCLVKSQTSGVNNGIYVVDTGAWSRSPDFDGTNDVVTGSMSYVVGGTANGNKFFQVTTAGTIIPGTTSITIAVVTVALGAPAANSIAYSQIQQLSANTILGNASAALANVAEISIALNQLFGRGSAGNLAAISLGSGLLMTGTTLSVSASALSAANLAFVGMYNGTITTSRGANAETIAIKTFAGADPSASDPVTFIFRDVTLATGDYVFIQATAALSVTVSSGSTLGMTNATLSRIWLVVFNDASTLRLGVVNALSGTSIMALGDNEVKTSTAEGGAGAADSAQVIYTGVAVAAKAMRVIGYLEYTLAAVGVWVTAPSKVQLYGPGVPLPGRVVQTVFTPTTAAATGATTVPHDDTIPQSGEGDQFQSQAITPTSTCNVLVVSGIFVFSNSASVFETVALFQDAVANALVAFDWTGSGAGFCWTIPFAHRMVAGIAAATTFKQRAGGSGAGTTTINGVGGARIYGGVNGSRIQVEELMT